MTPGSPTPGGSVAFTDEGKTQQSGYEGRDAKVELRQGGARWLITAYQGQQNTGGHAIQVEKATVSGTVLTVQARFTTPPPGAIVTQVLTSPAHTIGVPFAPDEVILLDQDGRERARVRR